MKRIAISDVETWKFVCSLTNALLILTKNEEGLFDEAQPILREMKISRAKLEAFKEYYCSENWQIF